MSVNHNILNELKELGSSLAPYSKENPYQVPPGYFEGFSSGMLARVKALEALSPAEELEFLSPVLASLSKENPYSVPVGYFENLETGITEKKLSDIHEPEISPLLNNLRKQNPYEVPAGYFESLPEIVMARLERKPQGKLVPFVNRRVVRLAMAAVLIGMVALSGVLYLTRDRIDPVGEPTQWVEKQMKKVPDENLDEFIEIAGAGELVVANQAIPEVNQIIQNVSDEELEEFIDDAAAADDESIFLN